MSSDNITFCVVAAIFLGASIYTIITCKQCSPFIEYEKSLNSEQKVLYTQIVEERQKIYLTGLILGTILAFAYLYFNKLDLNPLKHSCIFVAIALVTQYMYYMLYPKSAYMVNNLENKDQSSKWLAVYKTMQYKYHVGMILGLVGYFLLSYGLLKN